MWAANQSPMSRITAVSRDCRGIDEERSVHSTMALFNILKKEDGTPQQRPVPQHIAVIMDGNGRWAKKRGLPRTAGHKVGAETFRNIATYCKDIGVKYFTVYAFSTENWKRPAEEVDTLMNLFRRYLKEAIETMAEKGVAVRVIGDLSVLAEDIQQLIADSKFTIDLAECKTDLIDQCILKQITVFSLYGDFRIFNQKSSIH